MKYKTILSFGECALTSEGNRYYESIKDDLILSYVEDYETGCCSTKVMRDGVLVDTSMQISADIAILYLNAYYCEYLKDLYNDAIAKLKEQR